MESTARVPIKVAVLAAVLAAGLGPAGSGEIAVAQNDPAPPLFGTDLAGASVRVDWSASRLTLVNFWATWCEPCRRELPVMQQLQERYAEQGLRVVGVCKERIAPADIAAWLEPLGVRYTILTEKKRFAGLWGGTDLLPTSFLVGDGGIVLRRYVGGAPEALDALVSDVDAFFAGRPLAEPYTPRPAAGD